MRERGDRLVLAGAVLEGEARDDENTGDVGDGRRLADIGGMQAGQTQWIPAVVGPRLAEGDDIRAYSGATVELGRDASTVVVAENSRLLLTKMEYDPQSQSRLMLLHLVVAKVRATGTQAAVTLARARQSNFADGQKSMMAVEPEVGFTEGSSQGVWRQ